MVNLTKEQSIAFETLLDPQTLSQLISHGHSTDPQFVSNILTYCQLTDPVLFSRIACQFDAKEWKETQDSHVKHGLEDPLRWLERMGCTLCSGSWTPHLKRAKCGCLYHETCSLQLHCSLGLKYKQHIDCPGCGQDIGEDVRDELVVGSASNLESTEEHDFRTVPIQAISLASPDSSFRLSRRMPSSRRRRKNTRKNKNVGAHRTKRIGSQMRRRP